MNSTPYKWINLDYLIVVVFLQAIVCLTVFFDIPIARQVMSFFFFTFVPGYTILKLLMVDNLGKVETVLFSAGFSIAFLLISGLVLNESSLLVGFFQPLSLVPLMLFLNTLILVGVVAAYLRNRNVKIFANQPIVKIQIKPAFIFLVLPILSIAGAVYVNIYENNLLLLFMMVSVAALVVGGVLSKKFLPSQLYPIAVVTIGIALLFHATLISSYIMSYGSDVPWEYFVFKSTQSAGYWSTSNPYFGDIGLGRYYSMLSITVLPTIYSSILNMDQMMFKVIFPAIFSLVPLGLYQLWQGYVGKKFALIAAFLLMAQATFYFEMISLNRQIIAELFFVLILLVMLKKDLKPFNKILFFMIFSFALIVSHYALAEILLFFIALTAILLVVLKRPSRNITLAMIVLFFVMMFTWYIFTSGSATFDSFLQFGGYVYNQMGNFFNPASRGQTVLVGLGLAESPSVWNTASRVFAFAVEGFILLGFVGLITKRSKIKIEREYFILSSAALLILSLLVIVPGLATTLNMTRFFHILLFFLAPFFPIGIDFLVRLFSKRDRVFVVSAVLLLVLVPYFFFQTNFVYEVTGSQSWSVPLSGYRMNGLQLYASNGYLDPRTASGAKWFSTQLKSSDVSLYADERTSSNVLSMYGLSNVNPLTNTTIMTNSSSVFLGALNVVTGLIPYGKLLWNSSDLSFVFENSNVIYSDGGSLVYENP